MTTTQPVNSRASPMGVRDDGEIDAKPAGTWQFYTRRGEPEAGILFICPCGCGDLSGVSIKQRDAGDHPCWSWDGNRESPTLAPSINILQLDPNTGARIGEHWHGYLIAGQWRAA